jgi:hypothetical protein
MSLINAIATAATKSLLAKLPAAAAAKFDDIDEDEFKEFLQEFLATELKAGAAKGTRSSGVKGKNGKGRISGYILFSNAHRQEVKDANPDIKFTEVGKELGKMWGKLSDAQKAKWNGKAQKQNEENGLPTPTPGAKSSPKKGAAAKGKASAAKKSPAKGKAAAKKDAAPVMKISRNKDAKAWVIQGTNFVVQSPKNKVVIGKLRGTKVMALSAGDIKKCEAAGYEVKAAPAKAPTKTKAPTKSKKAQEPESDDEDDDDDVGSDHDDEDDHEDSDVEKDDAGSDDDDSDDDE